MTAEQGARLALCSEIWTWDHGEDDGHYPPWVGNLADHLIAAGYRRQEQ
jgi:hypothetical protein